MKRSGNVNTLSCTVGPAITQSSTFLQFPL